PNAVCDAETIHALKALRLLRRTLQIAYFSQSTRERPSEQNQFDEQQGLWLLSGLSLTCRQALPSGTFLIRTRIACLAFVFSRVALGPQRACSVPSSFALPHILVPKGLSVSCSSFCRAKSDGVQAKNSGIHPDRQILSRPHILRAR